MGDSLLIRSPHQYSVFFLRYLAYKHETGVFMGNIGYGLKQTLLPKVAKFYCERTEATAFDFSFPAILLLKF